MTPTVLPYHIVINTGTTTYPVATFSDFGDACAYVQEQSGEYPEWWFDIHHKEPKIGMIGQAHKGKLEIRG